MVCRGIQDKFPFNALKDTYYYLVHFIIQQSEKNNIFKKSHLVHVGTFPPKPIPSSTPLPQQLSFNDYKFWFYSYMFLREEM